MVTIDAEIGKMLLTGPWAVYARLSTVIFCGSPFIKYFAAEKAGTNVAINEAVEMAKFMEQMKYRSLSTSSLK